TRRGFDVYFEPNFVPLGIRAKKLVVTVHDLSFLLFPQWHPEDRVRYITEGFFERTLHADRIITPSNYVKKEIEEMFPSLEGRVSAVHLGVDKELFNPYGSLPSLKTPENFILFVGSIEPRKNLKNLLKAYNILPEQLKREFPLLLAGFDGWKNEEILELIRRSERYIKYIGYVNDEVLAELYRRASVFIYPSYYEGFGLPPIEAMACGAPVIVTNRASLPEVCGEGALYIQNPDDPEEIAHILEKTLLDESLRKELRQKGLKRAELFDWEKTAREHYRLLAET
ncbi:MAG: glycosyltransferase family 4 protein, partial [Aquificae bacterium]|nr:glycosyltransferase family 4 protein [Aquificota bacterium]